MVEKNLVVRVIEPSNQPALPKVKAILKISPKSLKEKAISFLMGSGIGIGTGITIYLMLILVGLDLGSLESSVIIGLPSLLGILASYIISQ